VGTQFQLVKSELELGLIIGTRFGTGTKLEMGSRLLRTANGFRITEKN